MILFEDCEREIYLNSALKDYLSQIFFEMVSDKVEAPHTVYLSSAFLATAKAVYLHHNKPMNEEADARRFYEIVGEAMRIVTE